MRFTPWLTLLLKRAWRTGPRSNRPCRIPGCDRFAELRFPDQVQLLEDRVLLVAAPAGTDKTLTTNEDTALTIATADFGFTDPNDAPADSFSQVTIATLPAAGTLKKAGAAISAGAVITVAELGNGDLTFEPAAHANGTPYTSFTFQVQDDGGGADTDLSANTITVNVTSVNDAPAGTVNTGVTVNEGQTITIVTANLQFQDIESAAASLSYSLDTAPGNGSLFVDTDGDGSPTDAAEIRTAGESFTQDDIDSGRVKFRHDGSDTTSDSFQFDLIDGDAGQVDNQTFNFTITPADTEVTLSGGVLTVTDVNNGGDSNDALTISYSGGTYTIADTGNLILDASSVVGSATNGTSSITVPDTGVTGILFAVLGGDDSVTVTSIQTSLTGSLTVTGGTGTDTAIVNGQISAQTVSVTAETVNVNATVQATGGVTLSAGGTITIASSAAVTADSDNGRTDQPLDQWRRHH